jgi:phosphoribosylaminoimidazole-succinocarboxamide synthase
MTSGNSAPTACILGSYPLVRQGKVRDVYDLGDELLLVASDRLSAFDVVLPTPVEGKGIVLTQLSLWWFNRIGAMMPNHLVDQTFGDLDVTADELAWLQGRTTRVRRAKRIDVECVVRGYLAGSGWKEYRKFGSLADEPLESGLLLGSRLSQPVFTPALKNDDGHDQNVSMEQLREIVGDKLADDLRTSSLAIYTAASGIAADAGFVLADTKLEFGYIDGKLALIDELLTPDSSRYWDASSLEAGKEPPSFDKQIVRDWLETTSWNKQAPGPEIPDDILLKAKERYEAVLERLSLIESSGGSA